VVGGATGLDAVLQWFVVQTVLIKRTAPVKALLLDQTFLAGVGNWIADEVWRETWSVHCMARSLVGSLFDEKLGPFIFMFLLSARICTLWQDGLQE
jgi:formamidopyrimidine-DNA glycosylase